MSVSAFAAAQALRMIPRAKVSRAVGRLMEQPLPPGVFRAVMRTYCRAYGVDLTEAVLEDQPYATFDAFFTRRLREGIRPISEDVVVSPADGLLSAAGPIDSASRIWVKGRPYDVAELTGDPEDDERYRDGAFAVVYLSPSDYHRFHSPVDGDISLIRGIPGDYFPVNSFGEKHVPKLFVRNNRVAVVIRTGGLGNVTAVLVGAYIVGKININAIGADAVPPGEHSLQPTVPIRRGEELGAFHLGSTAVALFENGVYINRPTGIVKYGQSLLKAP